MARDWAASDIPSLSGKAAIVTGGNSGIGFHTALELGRHGAEVVIGCRDPGRGAAAVADMKARAPEAAIRAEALDLASLASVRAFVERYRAGHQRLDILVANAGVMAIPARSVTEDGFEVQFGTNHLGHFALFGLLLPLLRASGAARVVTVSSSAAHMGKLRLDDLQSERRYAPMSAYAQSKLANLLFMRELDRRGRGAGIVSVAAHPGATTTNLQKHAFGRITPLIGQSADQGALPSLYAATAGEASSGSFIGPKRWFGMKGPPTVARQPGRAGDAAAARALWETSERLTGVAVPLGAGA